MYFEGIITFGIVTGIIWFIYEMTTLGFDAESRLRSLKNEYLDEEV